MNLFKFEAYARFSGCISLVACLGILSACGPQEFENSSSNKELSSIEELYRASELDTSIDNQIDAAISDARAAYGWGDKFWETESVVKLIQYYKDDSFNATVEAATNELSSEERRKLLEFYSSAYGQELIEIQKRLDPRIQESLREQMAIFNSALLQLHEIESSESE